MNNRDFIPSRLLLEEAQVRERRHAERHAIGAQRVRFSSLTTWPGFRQKSRDEKNLVCHAGGAQDEGMVCDGPVRWWGGGGGWTAP